MVQGSDDGLTLAETGRLLRRHRDTIRKWLSEGCPWVDRAETDRGSEWRLDPAAVVRWLEERSTLRERAKAEKEITRLRAALSGTEAPLSIEEGRRRKVCAEARLAELDAAEREGSMVPADDVESAWVATTSGIRTRLLAVPGKVAPLVAAETEAAVCQELIREVLYEAMEEIADAPVTVVPHEPPDAETATTP